MFRLCFVAAGLLSGCTLLVGDRLQGADLGAQELDLSSGDLVTPPDMTVVWQSQTSPTLTQALHGVWGNATDVFAVGTMGTILHRTASSSWTQMSNPDSSLLDLYSVWGSSTNDVYAVGAGGRTLHYDGTSWSVTTNPAGGRNLLCVWGSSATDVWVVGDNGWVMRNTAAPPALASWTQLNSGVPNVQLFGVGGTSDGSELYIAGLSDTVLRSSDHGVSWFTQTISPPGNNFEGVWVRGPGEAFVAGSHIFHLTNGNWVEENPPPGTLHYLESIAGAGNVVHAVGQASTILVSTGSGWLPEHNGVGSALWHVWRTAGSSVLAGSWAVGDKGTILYTP